MGTTRMEYGYCEVCREFHAAQADFNSDAYTRAPIMGGGWMRCCGDSLRAWVVYHPAPWEPGTTVRCVFGDDPFLHAMRYCVCGNWHWCKAMCHEEAEQ
ncbi:hypothetical protein [Streptomyces sp. NPDC017260]|uniref:hypothetical protein n=1 Tax=unclassified Streptomyces TaxID=2593676 RepID=UPI0037B7F351